MQMELLLGITLFLPLGTWAYWATGGAHWDYTGEHGASQWHSGFAACGGKRQSPINIETGSRINIETGSKKREKLKRLRFYNYKKPADTMKVSNNGHTIKVEMEGGIVPVVRQGGLRGIYVFAQLHFHWGRDSAQGSEHTIDGVRYPLEMHIVHIKKSYGGLQQALAKPDGLAVLSVMFEVGQTSNHALTTIVNTLANITEFGMVAEVSRPFPLQAFLPDDTKKFYRYEGSLTTPPCNEAVIWTLFDTTVKISEDQLKALRALKAEAGHKLVDNYRPTQALNDRKLRHVNI